MRSGRRDSWRLAAALLLILSAGSAQGEHVSLFLRLRTRSSPQTAPAMLHRSCGATQYLQHASCASKDRQSHYSMPAGLLQVMPAPQDQSPYRIILKCRCWRRRYLSSCACSRCAAGARDAAASAAAAAAVRAHRLQRRPRILHRRRHTRAAARLAACPWWRGRHSAESDP